jgi:hypothetical protein
MPMLQAASRRIEDMEEFRHDVISRFTKLESEIPTTFDMILDKQDQHQKQLEEFQQIQETKVDSKWVQDNVLEAVDEIDRVLGDKTLLSNMRVFATRAVHMAAMMESVKQSVQVCNTENERFIAILEALSDKLRTKADITQVNRKVDMKDFQRISQQMRAEIASEFKDALTELSGVRRDLVTVKDQQNKTSSKMLVVMEFVNWYTRHQLQGHEITEQLQATI